MKKPAYLLLALLLPILIFVFLKFAGKNEFNIPVYYQSEAVTPGEGCPELYPVPYTLQGWDGLPQSDWRQGNVLVFPQEGLDFPAFADRLREEMGDDEVLVKGACELAENDNKCMEWRKCVFLAKTPYQTVLFDKEGRIRGYYDLSLRDEEDRLRVELKILLKKY